MAVVDKDSANWRLFGGGGLLVGGLLWLIAALVGQFAPGAGSVILWILAIGLLVVGVGFILVALGQTGSNGAVGNNVLGKVALFAAAFGFIVWALISVVDLGINHTLLIVAAGAIFLGSLVGAVVILQKDVARGIAKYALFAVSLLSLIALVLPLAGVAGLSSIWVIVIFAVVTAATGLLYLLNRK